MWVFTNYGFVSAVAHRNKKGILFVRAREPEVLEMLCKRNGISATVRKTEDADYLYRAEIPQREFAKAIAGEILRIDYGNFKNSFTAADPKNTHVSHMALMDVWCVMHGLQYEIKNGGRVYVKESMLPWIYEPETHSEDLRSPGNGKFTFTTVTKTEKVKPTKHANASGATAKSCKKTAKKNTKKSR